jgi:hypothetical protein
VFASAFSIGVPVKPTKLACGRVQSQVSVSEGDAGIMRSTGAFRDIRKPALPWRPDPPPY